MTRRHVLAVATGLCLCLAVSAQAGSDVKAKLKIPGTARVSALAEGCNNNPGPWITLEGELSLGGLNGRLIFRNNAKGTHERDEDVTVDIVQLNKAATSR